VGFFPATILKNLYIHSRRIVVAEMSSDLDGAVDHGIVLDESADETDDDDWRCRNSVGCTDRACRAPVRDGRDEAKNKRDTTD
jgi:hypothetical protein